MRRVIILSGILSMLICVLPKGECLFGGEKESPFDRVLVSVELPPEAEDLSERKLESWVEYIIPCGFTVEKIKRDSAVFSGVRSRLDVLEGSGLEIRRVTPVSGGSKQAGRLSHIQDLAFASNWGPFSYPEKIVTDIYVDSVEGEEGGVVIGDKETISYYDRQGTLLWSDTLPDEITFLATPDSYYTTVSYDKIVPVIGDDFEGGVYIYDRTGALIGSWTSSSCGIDDVEFYDLDADGSTELIIELEDCDTFYVLDHEGNLEWSGTVTDNIKTISYIDLYGNGQYEIIIFSRDLSKLRGQISSFTPNGVLLGERNYTEADLKSVYAPYYASYVDLDGDGTEEIVPYPRYLNQKLEILSDSCAILAAENLDRDIEDYEISYDFNGDDNADIALMTTTDDPDTLRIQGFLGFNGSGFDATWSYPATETIDRDNAVWDMDESGIAFGIESNETSGGKVYLLNPSDGTDRGPPVEVNGSVDDLVYQDLNNDSANEVAVVISSYSDPINTWTFYVYDQTLNLLVPSGHFSYQLDTGYKCERNCFSVRDMDGDGLSELIPTNRDCLPQLFPLVDYTGALKWSYSTPGDVTIVYCGYDIDGDGNNDIGLFSLSGGGSHIALLKDNGDSYGIIGERTFSSHVMVSAIYHDFDSDGRLEIILRGYFDRGSFIYSYDLSHCFWSFTPMYRWIISNNCVDIDGNGIDDICMSTYYGGIYVFFGYALPKNPVLCSGDYDGDWVSDIAVFRRETGLWAVRGVTRVYFGGASDIPVPGDYDGDMTSDIGIYQGASGLWAIRGITRTYFGSVSDIPVPGDYNCDGYCDIGIFRESSGLWAIKGITRAYFGAGGDAPVPGYYNWGWPFLDIGIFRSSTGLWAVRGMTRAYFGGLLDVPVPGSYEQYLMDDIAIFRPSTGLWAVRDFTRTYFGTSSDQPVPAAYSRYNAGDIGIFRPSSGLWAIQGVTRAYFGDSSNIPVTR